MIRAAQQLRSVGMLVMAVLAVAGCSTQALRVDCEKRLQPINAPTPKPAPVPAGDPR